MASNSFGDLLRITTFGESHGIALGVVIDGCPPGIPLTEEDLLPDLRRRRPGHNALTSQRKEEDVPSILSGTFEGRTTGMPITVIVRNQDARPEDYTLLKKAFRPGHADETFDRKYGHRDHRGGGRSSGRETVARVIAGVVAKKILPSGLKIIGHTLQIGPHVAKKYDEAAIEQNLVRCADADVAREMEAYIAKLKAEFNSSGGLFEICVSPMLPNLGDPVFGKLKAKLADGIMSIGAVTGFSYGEGFGTAGMTGIEYISNRRHFGGILGGISTGEDLILHASVKPTTSLGEVAKRGRHDPCIVARVIPVAEAMVALVLADAYLMNTAMQSVSPSPIMTLKKLRADIDGLDSLLLATIAKRFTLCKQIAECKEQIEDPERERLLHNLWREQSSPLGLSEPFALALLALILRESKAIQKNR